MNKISEKELIDFYFYYERSEEKRRHMRFGQLFMNKFFPSVGDPDVFYDESPYGAYCTILEKYVELPIE